LTHSWFWKKNLTPSQAILDCQKIYLSFYLRYLDKIWFANRLWPSEAVTSTDTKPEVVFSRRSRHFEKWIWRHISAVGASIWTKFGSSMQNNVQISGKWSKSKPKLDFQYGGRLFFKNGSSYISAINWDMSTKFGLLIDFDLLKAAISANAKPEIVLSGRRHLDKAIWRPNRSNTIAMVRYVQPKGRHMILQVSLKVWNYETDQHRISGQYLDKENVFRDAVLWRHNKSKMADGRHLEDFEDR